MPPSREEVAHAVDELVDECRSECLWFQRPDYYPRSDVERLRVLDDIQKHAGVKVFQRAARLKTWLSLRSSSASAES